MDRSAAELARNGVNVCDSAGNIERIGGDGIDDSDKALQNTFMTFFADAGVDEDVVRLAFESLACFALPISSFVAEKFKTDVAQGSLFLGGCE